MDRILIIIPAYNEEESIQIVLNSIIENYPEYDYVVINDCSTDSTLEILNDGKYNYISLPCNLGIGGAVQTGYQYAVENNYDIAVQIDGDGQHDPAYIHKLISAMDADGYDMVIGSRFIENQGFQSSSVRRLGINFLKNVIYVVSHVKITDTTSGFRATNKKMNAYFALNYAQDYPETEAIVSATLSGYSVGEVPVHMNERLGGTSSISGFKSLYFMIKVSLALLVTKISIKKEAKDK